MNQWIKCGERLPLELDAVAPYKTEQVIVTDGTFVSFAIFVTGNGCGEPWREFSKDSTFIENITHWMPMPQPPGGDEA